jgi:PAS domain S-box-containing protein
VLATERQLLLDIVEALPDPTFVVDADKRVIAWNHAVEALTGVRKEAVLGQGSYAYALPLYGERRPVLLDLLDMPQQEVERSYTYVKRIGDSLYAEAFLPRLNDGRGAHLWGVAAPLFDASGRRIGAIEVIRDVTERKRAEEALHESERKARAIFDLSFGFIGLLSPEGALLDANRTALDFEGIPAEQVIGRPFWECPWWSHDPAVQQGLQAAIQRARAGELVRYETTHRASDGSLHTIDFTLKPVRDETGQVVMLIPEGRDITDRKRMEEALRLSLLQLKANLDNTPNVAIQWYDEEGKILFWNPASEAMYGWKADEVLGKTLASFAYGGEDAAETHRILLEVLATGRTFGPKELRIRRRDGTFCWVLSTTFTMPLGGGRTGGVSMDVDITERKQAEDARAQLQLQLLQAQKMEVVGRLAGGVAHDFNNMLGVILGRADLALSELQPGDRVHASLLEILKAARHSAELTRQLLAFARKQAVEPRILDLNRTVEGTLKMLRRLIGEDIELAWLPGADLWPLRMDPSQIDQVLANLCVNARDALSAGGSITIESGNVILDERYCRLHYGAVPGAFVALSVRDTGCGMEPEILQHIFEPFFTTKPSGQGTGLGLATVYGIVQQNAGYIEVESQPGRGTCFRVYLPRAESTGEETVPEPAARAARGRGEILLLAEDDELLRNISKETLTALGYRVLAAGSAPDALRMAEASPGEIHLLITDVVMPGMNGRELAERLRARKPDLKCLYISGHAPDYIQAQGVLPQGAAFLRKPYSLQELAARVREALEAD